MGSDLVDGVSVPLWPVHQPPEHGDGEGVAEVVQRAQDGPEHMMLISRDQSPEYWQHPCDPGASLSRRFNLTSPNIFWKGEDWDEGIFQQRFNIKVKILYFIKSIWFWSVHLTRNGNTSIIICKIGYLLCHYTDWWARYVGGPHCWPCLFMVAVAFSFLGRICAINNYAISFSSDLWVLIKTSSNNFASLNKESLSVDNQMKCI